MEDRKEIDPVNRIFIKDMELRLWAGLLRPPACDDRIIYLFKDRPFLDRLDAIIDRVRPTQMIEVGILDGGSTIYWQDRYRLQRLVAFDIEPAAPPLVRYLKRHNLNDMVRTYFGVAQDDGPALRAAISESTIAPQVDVIVDDASHQFAETRETFQILLPFLRPGGAYIIEDWAWGHSGNWPPDLWANKPLMSPLLSELMLVCGKGTGLINRLEIDPNFVVIWRGDLDIGQQGEFKLADHYTSRSFSAIL